MGFFTSNNNGCWIVTSSGVFTSISELYEQKAENYIKDNIHYHHVSQFIKNIHDQSICKKIKELCYEEVIQDTEFMTNYWEKCLEYYVWCATDNEYASLLRVMLDYENTIDLPQFMSQYHWWKPYSGIKTSEDMRDIINAIMHKKLIENGVFKQTMFTWISNGLLDIAKDAMINEKRT